MTGVTWNRPSSKTSAENPVLWCEPRILVTRTRRCTSTSVIGCILSSSISSERKITSSHGGGLRSKRDEVSKANYNRAQVGTTKNNNHQQKTTKDNETS